MLLKFIQVVRCIGSCIFTAEDISQFNQSPIIRYFSCFQFGAITNETAMNLNYYELLLLFLHEFLYRHNAFMSGTVGSHRRCTLTL